MSSLTHRLDQLRVTLSGAELVKSISFTAVSTLVREAAEELRRLQEKVDELDSEVECLYEQIDSMEDML